MDKRVLFTFVFPMVILGYVVEFPIAEASGASAGFRTNHNMPNPMSPPETQDISDLYFYAPLAIIIIILATSVCFLMYRRKQNPLV